MYIFCDCSDCGNSRVNGPCYLEKHFIGKPHHFIAKVRREQIKMEKRGVPSTCIVVGDNNLIKDSVLRVSVV
jgi:hypothetical protein